MYIINEEKQSEFLKKMSLKELYDEFNNFKVSLYYTLRKHFMKMQNQQKADDYKGSE